MANSPTPEQIENTVITRELPVPDQGPAEKRGTLTVLMGPNIGATFELGSAATLLGRNPRAHVSIEDDGASRNHARILRLSDHYELEDMGSTNGTYVDGARVRGRIALHDGARIQIGNTLLRFARLDQIEWEASKRVYEASVRDALTGAFNRRYFEDHLFREFGFAARHGTPLSVMLVDLDRFKEVNDQHGHQAGDHVLRRVASELRAAMRIEDLFARYGGEEFAVVTRGIGVPGTRAFAERLRARVERAAIDWNGQPIAMTASIGMAHNHSGAAATDPQRMLAAADQALYAAKDAGRNRVELAMSPGRYAVRGDPTPAAEPGPRPWDDATAPRDGQHGPSRLLPPPHRGTRRSRT
jgi:two-component system, cell cycle response regulator